jgi:hypothetical protein
LTAVAPISLSVMRVIRDALIPARSESQIAELLMSGFFRELPAASANERAYDWAPAVQQQLSSARRESQAPDVRQASDLVAGGLPYWEAPFDEHGERIGRDLVVRLLRGLQLEHVHQRTGSLRHRSPHLRPDAFIVDAHESGAS